MRYIPPYGATDINLSYANGNPVIGLKGSIPPAEMVEHPLRELTRVIGSSGNTLSMFDLEQVTKSARSQFLNFAIDRSDTPNQLVTMFNPAFTQLTPGLPLHVYVANDNTGPSTILVDTIGPVYIIRANGASLTVGDLYAGQVACLVFDGSYFQLQNYLGKSTNSLNNSYFTAKIPYAADTSSTANTVNAPYNPALTAVQSGLLVEVKIANTNTGPVIFYPNALPGRPIRKPSAIGFQDMVSGDVVAGQVLLLVYDGIWEQWQLVNAPKTRKVYDQVVQLVNRYNYQSTNQAWIVYTDDNTTIFTTNYTPKAAGNKLKVSVTGGMGYESLICPRVCIYLAYRTTITGTGTGTGTGLGELGGQGGAFQWIPIQFPGLDYPPSWPLTFSQGALTEELEADFSLSAEQALMANVAVVGFEYPNSTSPVERGLAGPSPVPGGGPTFGFPIDDAFYADVMRHNPGLDWGSFAWEVSNTKGWERFARNFVINAHLTVPPGNPQLTFALFFRPISQVEWKFEIDPFYNPVIHLAHGGIMLQVYEYTA